MKQSIQIKVKGGGDGGKVKVLLAQAQGAPNVKKPEGITKKILAEADES